MHIQVIVSKVVVQNELLRRPKPARPHPVAVTITIKTTDCAVYTYEAKPPSAKSDSSDNSFEESSAVMLPDHAKVIPIKTPASGSIKEVAIFSFGTSMNVAPNIPTTR